MTSQATPATAPADEASATVPANSPQDNANSKPAAVGFAALFSAAAGASGKANTRAWQQGNKSSHEKKIGPAPSGTRRSMGKR